MVSFFQGTEEEFMWVLGQRIKELRQQRGTSLAELARQVGVTSSFLSQLERGKKSCSLMTLHRITAVLSTTVGDLFATAMPVGDDEARVIVRRDARPPVILPGIRQRLYLLSPSRDLGMEPLLNVLPPGVATSDHAVSHGGEEWIYVLRGQVQLTLDQATYTLGPGDSAGFASSRLHRMVNIGREDAEVIWVNTPRQF